MRIVQRCWRCCRDAHANLTTDIWRVELFNNNNKTQEVCQFTVWHQNVFLIISNWLVSALTPRFSGSGLWPCGLGGVLSLKSQRHDNRWIHNKIVSLSLFVLFVDNYLGSCWPVLPRPYNGITLSLLIPALHTGHTCLFGLVSNHCNRNRQGLERAHRNKRQIHTE